MKMKKRERLPLQIIEISQKMDKTVKEIDMLVHRLDFVNDNGLDFLEDNTIKHMNTLIDKPVVAKYFEDIDDLGGHEQEVDENGNIVSLNTESIGTITDVWIDNVKGAENLKALYARATLWKYKYPLAVNAIERNFRDGNAETSVEVEIYEYADGATAEYRTPINYTYLGNCLLGRDVPPADKSAGLLTIADKEVASALSKDIKNKEGRDINLDNEKTDNKNSNIEVFNKGVNISNFTTELSSLTFDDITRHIYNRLNPVEPKSNEREYNYYIYSIYNDYVIVSDWRSSRDVMYSIGYRVEGEAVYLDEKDKWVKGSLGFIPDNYTELNAQIEQKNLELEALQLELNKKSEELVKMEEAKTQETNATESEVKALENKVDALTKTVAEQKDLIEKLQKDIAIKDEEINALMKYKEQVEASEKQAKVNEISEKYSKLISQETLAKEEVVQAIQELNTSFLNEIVVSEAEKQLKKVAEEDAKKELNSKNEDIIIKASVPKGIVEDLRAEFDI